MTPIHPTLEEAHIRQVDPAQRVESRPGNEWQQFGAEKPKAKRKQPEHRMLRALQKLNSIFGRLFFHALFVVLVLVLVLDWTGRRPFGWRRFNCGPAALRCKLCKTPRF